MNVRAKLRCSTETAIRYSAVPNDSRVYKFFAVYEPEVPEDQRYAKATPNASLEMTVDNPAVSFEPGKTYYLDFTEAE